ncbi:MAG: TM2 domain-containing protein [Lachnospiraceae bacterium]|nr:TM2 domain-containing protein [Lachnospiraceae bacterium]
MYYCKHCGETYGTDQAVVCVKCGAPKGKGNNFCQNCGRAVPQNAAICMNCGVALEEAADANAKSKIVAGLLGIFLGHLGVHNFYLGYTNKAVIQLVLSIVGYVLTCLGIGVFLVAAAGIWGLIEGIMILVGNINVDGQGKKLKD